MEQYTIYCTTEQARKALELGAPIIQSPEWELHSNLKLKRGKYTTLVNPTAEQMLNWLEEQGFKFNIYEEFGNSWYYYVGHRTYREPIQEFDNLKSRQAATIAAIDAALEYLTNKARCERSR